MPTDFDEFTPAAMEPFLGSSFEMIGRARLLKYAMHKAGFAGLRTEWWHFTIADWQKYLQPEKAKSVAQISGTHREGGF
jgi:D-alanyl-D-alanine dipeptidase